MWFLPHQRAVLLAIGISVLVALMGCTTTAPVREAASGPTERRTPAAPGDSTEQRTRDPVEEGDPQRRLPENASDFLDQGLSAGVEPVIVDGSVAAGWFFAPSDEASGAEMGAMGVYESPQSLDLAFRHAPAGAGDDRRTTDLSQLLPGSDNRRVRSFELVRLQGNSARPNGFRLRFSGDNQDEEVFVIWTAIPNQPPYTIRLPISAVRRTALRDLTGDDTREMVHLSVVFDTGGNREIIADALQWNAARFVHVGSVSLLQAINRELADLERHLLTSTEDRWKVSANEALLPIENSPPVGPLLPAMHVRVPRITELSIDLGRGEWEFLHDIAVAGNLYRLRIHLEANPLSEHPAQIVGFQGN